MKNPTSHKVKVLLTATLFGMLFLSPRPTFGQTLTPDTANGYPELSIIHGTEIEEGVRLTVEGCSGGSGPVR